jgi:hypothetical protein
MKVLRFRIAGVMVVIAVAALDFWAIRAVWGHEYLDLLATGALPMANVLAVGLLIRHRSRGNQPFLLGFETCGAMALAVYLTGMTLSREELVTSFINLVAKPYVTTFAPIRITGAVVDLYCLAAVTWGLPQLAFGVIGGFLSRRFKITITRR